METQLVRLDKPYNIIIGKKGQFALHIATLMVIRPNPDNPTLPLVTSYPVVADDMAGMDGVVWTDTTLDECMSVIRQNEIVYPYKLYRTMAYCEKNNVAGYKELIPDEFQTTMLMNNCPFKMSIYSSEITTDIRVVLLFTRERKGIKDTGIVRVRTINISMFYFNEYFSDSDSSLPNKEDAIESMARLRDNYLRIFSSAGLKSITFITYLHQYEKFVTDLNNYTVK